MMTVSGITKNGVVLISNRSSNRSDTDNKVNHKDAGMLDEEITAQSTYSQLVAQIRNVLMNDGEDFDDEEVRKKYDKKIHVKLSSGQPLTQKEKNYLKKYDAQLYQQVVRIENKRKMVENQLEHCKSKEEAKTIQEDAIASIGKDDPAREYMISAVNYTCEEFKKTDSYKELPATKEEAKKRKEQGTNRLKTEEDRQKDEGDDGAVGAVQYSVSLGSYQETFVGNAVTISTGDCFFNSIT